MKVVEHREPEKRAQFIHDDLVHCGTFVDNVHGGLIIAVDDVTMVRPLGSPVFSCKNNSQGFLVIDVQREPHMVFHYKIKIKPVPPKYQRLQRFQRR